MHRRTSRKEDSFIFLSNMKPRGKKTVQTVCETFSDSTPEERPLLKNSLLKTKDTGERKGLSTQVMH